MRSRPPGHVVCGILVPPALADEDPEVALMLKPGVEERIHELGIMEIVTGLGEITFVVHAKDQQVTFEAMQSLKK